MSGAFRFSSDQTFCYNRLIVRDTEKFNRFPKTIGAPKSISHPPSVYRPQPASIQLKQAAPPVYRPQQQTPQMKPAAPPVYKPLGQATQFMAAAPPVYRPQPQATQLKQTAPPVYRQQPQATQMKPAAPPAYKPQFQGTQLRPAAPPVYRPQPQTTQLMPLGRAYPAGASIPEPGSTETQWESPSQGQANRSLNSPPEVYRPHPLILQAKAAIAPVHQPRIWNLSAPRLPQRGSDFIQSFRAEFLRSKTIQQMILGARRSQRRSRPSFDSLSLPQYLQSPTYSGGTPYGGGKKMDVILGPRALVERSCTADPTKPTAIKNAKKKQERRSWR
jgi:hypothetical protein